MLVHSLKNTLFYHNTHFIFVLPIINYNSHNYIMYYMVIFLETVLFYQFCHEHDKSKYKYFFFYNNILIFITDI
jgi:hypothetical protein